MSTRMSFMITMTDGDVVFSGRGEDLQTQLK